MTEWDEPYGVRGKPPAHTLPGADPKIGGEEKTANDGERIPMCGTKAEADYEDQMREYRALSDRRDDLIGLGVDPMKLIVPLQPRRPSETTALPYKAHGNLAQCTDNYDTREHEHDMLVSIGAADAAHDDMLQDKADAAHDEYIRDLDMPLTTKEEALLIAKDLLSKAANPLIKVTPKSEYVWDGSDKSKDSNPKEAFGSRKAGLSTISKQVMYEVGLAMLEGALKYGRHNYRIAGVRASTYYDACGRHMDAWWEGQDIDPDSGAQLHHVTKAIAGLTVIRDSMLAGNWTDDRPPSIGDPNWLAWYNEQAAILVDACKNPKAPFTEKDHGK